MFTLPQPPTADNTIPVPEDSDTLEVLLKLALGLPAPLERLATFPAVDTVLRAADKYDMPGAAQVLGHVLRGLLASKTFARDPLRQYGIATHFSWDDIAQEAFDRLLVADIDFTSVPPLMNGPALGLLVAARQQRVRAFIGALRSVAKDALFLRENRAMCRNLQCSGALTDATALLWRRFVCAISLAFALVPCLDVARTNADVVSIVRELEDVTCQYAYCKATCFPWSGIYTRLVTQ